MQDQTQTNFGKHYKETHGSKAKNSTVDTMDASKGNEEYRILKNNFERLEVMYQDSLEEVNKVKSEYEARLIKANDDYDVVKSENEVLKEKVDVLFKLGRSYINNSSKKVENTDTINVQGAQEDEIQVLPTEEGEGTDNLEDLQAWSVNKMRGFRRNNPASNSIPKKPDPPKNSKPDKKKESAIPSPPSGPPPASAPPTQTPRPAERTTTTAAITVEEQNEIQAVKYCHYFVNRGSCRFEERTGSKCKFEHSVAPMCSFGINCSRHKCMFSHPKMPATAQNTFLGRNFPVMNPWQMNMMNPWMQNSTNQFLPNPWNQNQKNH